MQISKNKVVAIDYTLTGADGKVIDSSEGKAPLAYIHGTGSIISGLEKALEGKSAGDTLNVTIPPAEAYGERDDSLMQAVPRSTFGKIKRVEVGMQVQARSGNETRVVTIVGFDKDDMVKVDANHPLAGQTLTFDVKVAEVRDATKEELDHGHVHGPGGHHHH